MHLCDFFSLIARADQLLLDSDCLQISAFLQWLNIKGYRETKLNDVLQRWWDYIHKGAEKRWNVRPSL